MDEVRDLLKNHNIKPLGYTKKNNVIIIETSDHKYVLKKNSHKQELYNYLHLRNFEFFPNVYNEKNDIYEIQDYIEDYDIPKYDKALEIINLTSLLHNKTTIYKDIDIDDLKIIYEDLDLKINDLSTFYNELNNYIDSEIYMSPSNYLLIRNISKIYATLDFCKKELDVWYDLVKNNLKQRISLIHNNLNLNHLIRNEKGSYLISWANAKFDIPIYDIYKFYKNIYNEVSFDELFSNYETRYPLHNEEKKLLFILMSLPQKVNFIDDEYDNCIEVNNLLNYIVKTEKIISKYYANNEQEEDYNFTK